MSSIDEDLRLTIISDLMNNLKKQSFILDHDTQLQIVSIVLKLLTNINTQVEQPGPETAGSG
jgi:hypothetical protein